MFASIVIKQLSFVGNNSGNHLKWQRAGNSKAKTGDVHT